MNWYKKYGLAVICFSTFNVAAQQLPQSSQHMHTRFFLNPAVAGSEKYTEAMLNLRFQWAGFSKSPSNEVLSLQSSFNKSNAGVGGYLYNYQLGPIRNTGLGLAYAYHIELEGETKLGLGLGAVLAQYSVDGTQLVIVHGDDPLLDLSSVSTVYYPELNFGVYLHSLKYYLGISALNLTNQQTKTFPEQGAGGVMPRALHLNLIGSYKIPVSDEMTFIPSLFLNAALNNPVQVDLNIRMNYMKKIDIGIGYRTSDAITVLLGYAVTDYLMAFYTYDLQVSKLAKYSSGSHEIGIRFRNFFNTILEKQYKKEGGF